MYIPSGDVAVVFSGLNVTIQIGSLTDGDGTLAVVSLGGLVVLWRAGAYSVLLLLEIRHLCN